MSEPNSAIRDQMTQQRQALSVARREQAARDVAVQFAADQMAQDCQTLGVYIAHRGECDPSLCVQKAWEDGKACYLPVVHAGGLMQWARYQSDTVLQNNRYGIPEPVSEDLIDAKDLDGVLVPLVAFNDQRQRMGSGGGYFDRCFAFRGDGDKPYLIGLAYGFQCSHGWQPHTSDLVLDRMIIA